jgi:hypothetical protein
LIIRAKKGVFADFLGPLIVDLIIYFRVHVTICIGWGIIYKKGQCQILVHQQIGESQCQDMPILIFFVLAWGKMGLVFPIVLYVLQVVPNAPCEILGQFPLKPYPDKARQLSAYCFEKTLIILICGMESNVIRCLVPLVITDDELEKGLTIMEKGSGLFGQKIGSCGPAELLVNIW